ncbi:MAG: M23 family peptidase, partial [Sulfuriferula sp.]
MANQKAVSLTQADKIHARKVRLRWLVAASTLPLFGIIAAFGIAPQTDTSNIPVSTVVENLTVPANVIQADDSISTTAYWRDERIEPGDTVASVLNRLGVSSEETARFLRNHEATRALAQIKPGKRIQAQTTDTGELLWLRHINTAGTLLQISRQDENFTVTQQQAALKTRTVMKSGEIRSSLFGATDAAGIPDSITTQLADLFSTDIDFHKDLRPGDKFKVVYEAMYNNGELVMT